MSDNKNDPKKDCDPELDDLLDSKFLFFQIINISIT